MLLSQGRGCPRYQFGTVLTSSGVRLIILSGMSALETYTRLTDSWCRHALSHAGCTYTGVPRMVAEMNVSGARAACGV